MSMEIRSTYVEMNRGTVILEQVVDLDDDSVTPAGLDWWARHLTVNSHDQA